MRPARDRFLDDAASILATAEAAGGAGGGVNAGGTDYTLLIRRDGSLHMVADSDWPLDSLAAHHGAERAYRVCQKNAQIRVEGRAGARRCEVATEPGAAVARLMLGAPGLYQLIEPGSCSARQT